MCRDSPPRPSQKTKQLEQKSPSAAKFSEISERRRDIEAIEPEHSGQTHWTENFGVSQRSDRALELHCSVDHPWSLSLSEKDSSAVFELRLSLIPDSIRTEQMSRDLVSSYLPVSASRTRFYSRPSMQSAREDCALVNTFSWWS